MPTSIIVSAVSGICVFVIGTAIVSVVRSQIAKADRERRITVAMRNCIRILRDAQFSGSPKDWLSRHADDFKAMEDD